VRAETLINLRFVTAQVTFWQAEAGGAVVQGVAEVFQNREAVFAQG